MSIVLWVVWVGVLAASGSSSPRALASLSRQVRRICGASLLLFGTIGVVSYLLELEVGRAYLLTALPIGLVLLVTGRFALRVRLHGHRSGDAGVYRTILVGSPDKVEHVATRMRQAPGHDVVGAVIAGVDTDHRPALDGIRLFGSGTPVVEAAEAVSADTVVVCDADELTPARLRRLGWELGERGIRMIVAPSLTDIGRQRLHLEPAAGLPLVHVEHREVSGWNAVLKRGIDIVGSVGLLLVCSPLLLIVALGVATTSPGPVLYRQERIGRAGRPFAMLKFRSMVPDADARLGDLLAAQGTSDQPLFKVEADPRVTPIGRFLRKYSLDELPQLVNVLLGSMSLVGPRPQREAEVALYDDSAHRRLLVKPGMSGLWQVSGRSSLSWEESITLDLSYVENWSAGGDLLILAKTFKAVVAPGSDAH